MLDVLYHHAKFGWARISGAALADKNVEFLSVCLCVCLFVTLLNVRLCAPDFAMNALEHRNDFDAVESGNLCVHLCSTLKVSKNVSVSALQGLGLGLVSWQKSDVSVSWNCRKVLVSVSPRTKNRMSQSRLGLVYIPEICC